MPGGWQYVRQGLCVGRAAWGMQRHTPATSRKNVEFVATLSARHHVALGIRKGGAKRIVRFFGGKTYHKAPPPKPVLEASESGICLVCARFL